MTHFISSPFTQAGTQHSRHRDPIAEMSSLVVTENTVGAFISIGLFVIVWAYLPFVRPYLAGTLLAGGIFGSFLWLKRR
jgi:hypothetical protein